jgi:hypothetical protein
MDDSEPKTDITITAFEPRAGEGTLRGIVSAVFHADGVVVDAIEIHGDGVRRWVEFPEIIGFADSDTARRYTDAILTALDATGAL